MTGATADYRRRLRMATDEEGAREVEQLAIQIIDSLPKTDRLGTLSAAFMLAATSYTEFGAAAVRALREVAQETPEESRRIAEGGET